MAKTANLICLFNPTYIPATIKQMAEMGDDYVYQKAKEGVCDGSADIYTLDDFAVDFNNNKQWVSPDTSSLIFIHVDDSEINQWLK